MRFVKLSVVLNTIELTTASIERHHPYKGVPGEDPIAALAHNVQLLQMCVRGLAAGSSECTMDAMIDTNAARLPDPGCPTPELRPKTVNSYVLDEETD